MDWVKALGVKQQIIMVLSLSLAASFGFNVYMVREYVEAVSYRSLAERCGMVQWPKVKCDVDCKCSWHVEAKHATVVKPPGKDPAGVVDELKKTACEDGDTKGGE